VPLEQRPLVDELPSLRPALTALLVADRDAMEKAAKAYVSYVRAYTEHQCKYIFQFDKLDLGGLASSMALLRLPKLRELRKKRRKDASAWVEFTPAADVKLDDIRYKDRAREKQRQQNKAAAAAAAASGGSTSDAKGHRAPKRADSDGAGQRDAGGEQRKQLVRETASGKRKKAPSADDDEDDFALEARLMKKLKQGKISKAEFHRQLGESDED